MSETILSSPGWSCICNLQSVPSLQAWLLPCLIRWSLYICPSFLPVHSLFWLQCPACSSIRAIAGVDGIPAAMNATHSITAGVFVLALVPAFVYPLRRSSSRKHVDKARYDVNPGRECRPETLIFRAPAGWNYFTIE